MIGDVAQMVERAVSIGDMKGLMTFFSTFAGLAKSVERYALNLAVVCSSPTFGDTFPLAPRGDISY